MQFQALRALGEELIMPGQDPRWWEVDMGERKLCSSIPSQRPLASILIWVAGSPHPRNPHGCREGKALDPMEPQL